MQKAAGFSPHERSSFRLLLECPQEAPWPPEPTMIVPQILLMICHSF